MHAWYRRVMHAAAALAGLHVLDFTNLLAAPQIAATLADFGADVVKIEPRAGDPLRRIGVQRNGASPQWALVSRNKRAITLDLDQPDGRRIFGERARTRSLAVGAIAPVATHADDDESRMACEQHIRLAVPTGQ